MAQGYDDYNYDPHRRRFKYQVKAPWWFMRYGQLLFLGGLIIPFVWLYGPPFWHFLFPPRIAVSTALNPRLAGTERQIRKRFEQRDQQSDTFC